MIRNKNVSISEEEVRLLEVIDSYGPLSSQKVHEAIDQKFDYLFVMRCLHRLVEKGFLKRAIINKTQLYKTSRNYSALKSYLANTGI